ncbi:MAG: hypothetical protein LBJ10_00545, partial [Clostridiales bacterium]|nr:hypothetical protein [Clostridiales bacterium]
MRRLEEAREGKENHMLPFLWLHGEPQADILDEIGKIASCGIGAFCVEARPHPDFAGERWWSDMDAIMREARARGMRVWLLDDNRFPTGNANHAFRDKCPEKAKIYLGERHVDIIGPAKGHSLLIAPLLPEDAELLGVLALPKPDGATLAVRMEGAIDLAPRICDGFAHFDLPKGRHRLFALFATRTGGGREHYMNIIDKDSVRVLIDEVYEPHYARYKDDFGKTFAGFFSDEPEFGNTPGYDFCGSLGKRDVRLPWSAALDGALRLRWGGAFARSLPALWYEAGRETAAIRHAYMDEATKLVRGCLSGQLSAWCEERGVEYIGHTIEDDNAHARLGCGAGHFFREQGPKHMGGVDVVHCQILPGFTEPVHQWIAGDGDGEFFHFALAKLASSAARIDPKKRGRAMCEIFGNYGWAEGVGLMRWLADHMLVRGINQFVPHAFSPRYPEPDCPPHFFSRGSNPQFRFFSALARYMNRAAHLLSGGTRLPEAAILYHGDMEWAGKAMLSQKPARALLERRLDFDIVPADVFADGSAAFGGGLFSVNGAAYKSIVVPSCQYLPRHAADGLARASQKGVPVFFVGKRPSADTQAAPLPERFSSCGAAVPLAKLAGAVEKAAPPDLRVACASKELRVFSAEQPDGRALMFFNESVSRRIEAPVHAPAGRFGTYARYDGVNDALLRRRLVGDRFMLRLGPGESALYVLEKGGHIGGDGIG